MSQEIWQMRLRWAKGFVEIPVFAEMWRQECEKQIYVQRFIDEVNGAVSSNEAIVNPNMVVENAT